MEVLKYINLKRVLVCLFYVLSFIVNTTLSDYFPSILWAPNNPFFQLLGDSPRTAFLQDQIIFICPNKFYYPVQTTEELDTNSLYANIYMVDKKGYENCNATGGMKIKLCDKPSSIDKVVVRIVQYASVKGLPEFTSGEMFYFIDTSDAKNTSNLFGGKCQTHSMKMKLYICNDISDQQCPNGNKVTNGGWSTWQECSKSGTQTRQCNNPLPSNGGLSCQGNHTRACTITNETPTTTVTTPNNNETVTPKREKRTSVADTLGTLSVGAVVGIFLAIFIFGCILGLLVGVAAARIKTTGTITRRFKPKGDSNDGFNRNSTSSFGINGKSRPFSTISNDTMLSQVSGFTSYNNICDQVDGQKPSAC